MKKVAKLVYYSFVTRVVVDENASQDEIIKASRKNMSIKVEDELGENLEEIDDDNECPIGTFDTDLPSIDRVILNPNEKQYIVMGKGVPVQVVRFDNYEDWDCVRNTYDEPVFDVQIDDDPDGDDPYQFQYVNLILDYCGYTEIGNDYQSVKVEVVNQPITTILTKMLQKKS